MSHSSASAHEQPAKMHSEYTVNGHLGPGNDKSAVAAASLRVKGNDTDGDGVGEQSELSSGPRPLLGSHPLPHSKGFQSCQLFSHFFVRRTIPSLSEVSPCLEYPSYLRNFKKMPDLAWLRVVDILSEQNQLLKDFKSMQPLVQNKIQCEGLKRILGNPDLNPLRQCTDSYSIESDSVAPWAVSHQAPLSRAFSRQQCWSE